MATHSSVLAWRIPGTGEPGGLLSTGSHKVGHDGSDLAAAEIQRCGFSDHPPDGAMGPKHRVYQPQSEATSELSDHSLSMSPRQQHIYFRAININIHNWVNLNWFYRVLFVFLFFAFFTESGPRHACIQVVQANQDLFTDQIQRRYSNCPARHTFKVRSEAILHLHQLQG